ncbi:PEP-CTERM sorting domain-containing protein [Microcoleus sp. C2C3]|uniref:PEP-CTERM sorting domain-containing protein n=1 Tax=unclassified Microcoleus TaxID=2642155 RepID=UPI002FD1E212
MTLSRKLSIATAGAATILSALSVPVFGFTITQPTGAAYDLSDPLTNLPTGATGTVTLNPAVVGYLAPPAGGTLFTQFGAEAAAQFPNWTAVSGAALNGILTIDEYNARDDGLPGGGASMIATYARVAGPTIENLRFIQLFTDNTGANNALVSHIDPFPNDDNLPWYYTDTEHEQNSTANTMTFRDFPFDTVTTIPFNRTVRFEAYLATFNNTTKVATIHDGWSWGYDVQAVPEPATILGSAMALGGGAFFKRKVSRKRKKS